MSNLKKFENNYDWSGLKFPVTIKDIGVFETKNDIFVNLLAVEERDIYICQKSNCESKKKINLLLSSEDNKCHYTAIKSLSRLLASRNSKHKGKQHFCTNCLQGFSFKKSRDEHYEFCNDNETIRIEMPKKGSVIKFNDDKTNLRYHLHYRWTSNRSLNPPKMSLNQRAHSPRSLTITILLGFAFIVSSLMGS